MVYEAHVYLHAECLTEKGFIYLFALKRGKMCERLPGFKCSDEYSS